MERVIYHIKGLTVATRNILKISQFGEKRVEFFLIFNQSRANKASEQACNMRISFY